jgi:hypothetical protein
MPEEQYATEWTLEEKPGLEDYMGFLTPNDAYKYYYAGKTAFAGYPQSDFTWAFSNASLHFAEKPYNLE